MSSCSLCDADQAVSEDTRFLISSTKSSESSCYLSFVGSSLSVASLPGVLLWASANVLVNDTWLVQ